MYNIPIFTGVNIAPNTVARLSEIENIVGIKEEAELNPKQVTAFINLTPEDFMIYCGDDTMILESYAQGGEERIGGKDFRSCFHAAEFFLIVQGAFPW